MPLYKDCSLNELCRIKGDLAKQYDDFLALGLSLDMSRGKPGQNQLDLSAGLNTALTQDDYRAEDGTDCRNYGVLDGIPEMKRMFAALLDVDVSELVVGNNSSLSIMFDLFSLAMYNGLRGKTPWANQGEVKFLCPSPGYDRHFAICEYFGIKMIAVPMNEGGPDMDAVESLVKSDKAIKGIWCVPKYANPDGTVYSDETVRRLASLKPSANEFLIFWDNAYCLHHLYEPVDILNIVRECEKAGNPDMVVEFASFSKVTFAGGGISCVASSKSNIDYYKKRLSMMTIGPDKMGQLRHVRFFGDENGIYAHMRKHAEILRPKFEAVLKTLDEELTPTGAASFTRPKGGYFISVDVMDGCAKKVVDICKKAGVKLTPAGATYPYGKDPQDKNIRLAPTFPGVGELSRATALFCLAVKMSAVDKLISEN